MNVNIITVHASGNYGSFLQAYALSRVLSDRYPTFIVEAGVRNIYKTVYFMCIKNAIKGVFRGKFKYTKYYWEKCVTFHHNMKRLNRIPLKRAKGCFVFGSDEIWNLNRKEMRDYPILWGKSLNSQIRIAYAPSLNGCSIETLDKYDMSSEVRGFNALSARDSYSCSTLEKLTGRNVEKVLDPTLLISKDEYISNSKQIDMQHYIALYLFHVSDELIDFLLEFKQKHNLLLLSIGNWYDWCDKCVVSENPFDYYINADFVITNTFHGTAFAINLEKQFVSFSRSEKISELLNEFGLSDRDVKGRNYYEIPKLLETPIQFDRVRKLLEEKRELSSKYLFDSIES